MGIRELFLGRGRLGVCAAALTAAFVVLPGTVAKAQSTGSSAGDKTATQSTAPQPAATSTAQPNLAGTWKLNEKQSDDPREKMREAMQANSSEGGGGGGMMRGGRGRRPGRGGGGMMAEFAQLTIDQSDKGVKVMGSSGRVIATSESQPKNDQNAQDNGGGMMMRFPPAEAKWQGNQLVATSQGFGGGTTTRTFELSPDGKQLYVTTKIENRRFSQPVTYKLVYEPGKNGSNSQ
jgi:hypothetical protein